MSTATKSISLGRYAILHGSSPALQNKDHFIVSSHRSNMIDVKNPTKKRKDTELEHLIEITMESHETLATATSVFPFVLFPDTINIDREKITIVRRSFFRTAKVISIQIADILNVEGDVGPAFGSITLTSKFFLNSTQSIHYLKRKDVTKIQRLLQGYIIAHRQKIDCSNIDSGQLFTLLTDLGQGSSN